MKNETDRAMDSPHDREALCRTDRRTLWHPYTRIAEYEREDAPVIVAGEGARLVDVDGTTYLDGISSWWSAALGHGHARIIRAIQAQAAVLQHSILGGMAHPTAIRLAEALTDLAPPGLTRAYFASDGASAVEAAIRMAVQSFFNRGQPHRKGLIALADAYHGDTLGAVGAGYLECFHAPIRHLLQKARQAPSPHCFACEARLACDLRCFEGLRTLVERRAHESAAVIVEPLVQGSAGMRIYPADYLRRLRTLCDRHGLYLIADEIAVGMGRTGTLFACEQAGIIPDFLCLGKALTGGALPLSAVLTREDVFEAFRDRDAQDRTFYHGHTFCGNPIAAAAAIAALEAFRDECVIPRSQPLRDRLAADFEAFGEHAAVDRWAALGAIGVVRLRGGAAAARRGARHALRRGLLIRPLGDVLYLMPPLNTPPPDLDAMLGLFGEALDAAAKADGTERPGAIAE